MHILENKIDNKYCVFPTCKTSKKEKSQQSSPKENRRKIYNDRTKTIITKQRLLKIDSKTQAFYFQPVVSLCLEEIFPT